MNEGIKEFFQAHMHHFKYVAIWQKKGGENNGCIGDENRNSCYNRN